MDIRKVKKLIELLEESNIDEIEIKEGEESVRISRNGAKALAMAAQAAPAYAPPVYAPPALTLQHRLRRHPSRQQHLHLLPSVPAICSHHRW